MKFVLLLGLLALVGCAEWKCPNAPKVVARFSVGDHVAFTRAWTVWNSRSVPQSFWVDKGDTGTVTDIVYFDTVVRYEVSLDKTKRGEWLLTSAFEGMLAGREHHDIEAIIYPDPALAPTRGKQKA